MRELCANTMKMSEVEIVNKRRARTVVVEGLVKYFGEQRVLDRVSFEVKAGEIFVLMGPSGSGKSVLLRTVMGLLKADEGRVLIDGKDAGEPHTHEEIVTAIVFQAGALFNSLSVFDNLALYPREHRLYTKEVLNDKLMRVLGILGLEKAAKKMPSELSGGMKKRVAIARALMMEPQLILYDEPTSELDPVTSASIAEIIGTLKQEFDVTSIVVSHDRELSLAIADRLAVMFDGKIHALDTTDGIRACADARVKAFLNPSIDVHNPRFRILQESW